MITKEEEAFLKRILKYGPETTEERNQAYKIGCQKLNKNLLKKIEEIEAKIPKKPDCSLILFLEDDTEFEKQKKELLAYRKLTEHEKENIYKLTKDSKENIHKLREVTNLEKGALKEILQIDFEEHQAKISAELAKQPRKGSLLWMFKQCASYVRKRYKKWRMDRDIVPNGDTPPSVLNLSFKKTKPDQIEGDTLELSPLQAIQQNIPDYDERDLV